MANADYTFWLGRDADEIAPMRVWADERGCIAEGVKIHSKPKGRSPSRA